MRARIGEVTVAGLICLVALVAGLTLSQSRPGIAAPVSDDALGPITYVSIAPGHGNADGESDGGALSPDGRFVVFISFATNLVTGATNEVRQVYLRDTLLGATDRVSVSSTSEPANNYSFGLGVSGDGRYVLYSSAAWNLVPDDTNARFDLFLRDRVAGTTTRVSMDESGSQLAGGVASGALSDDGRFAAFIAFRDASAWGSPASIFLRDLAAGSSILVAEVPNSIASGAIAGPHLALSGDGRWLVFASDAPVTPADGSDLHTFVYDRVSGEATLVPPPAGIVGVVRTVPWALSADGRWLLLTAGSSHVDAYPDATPASLYLYDRQEGDYTPVPVPLRIEDRANPVYGSIMSGDGRFVAFIALLPSPNSASAGGPEEVQDLLLFDRVTKELSRPVTDFRGHALVTHPVPGVPSAGPPVPHGLSEDGSVLFFTAAQNYIHPLDQNGYADAFLFRLHAMPYGLRHRAVIPGIAHGEPLIINN